MRELEALLQAPPYGMKREEKAAFYTAYLSELTAHHRARCAPYGKLLDALGCGAAFSTPAELPFLPVSAFKALELKSVPEAEVYRVLTSSATTGQRPSRIVLDEGTSRAQQRALVHIVSDLLGPRRMPMLALDTKNVLRDRTAFSARGAGILGFSIFSSEITYALDGTMALDTAAVTAFAETHGDGPVLLFGFTYLVWAHFLAALKTAGLRLNLPGGVLIHGGGWKRLTAQAVSPEVFRGAVEEWTGVATVRDYYGMAEQTGSVFLECERGRLHASVWSDVLIRRPGDYGLCGVGEPGVIQVLSPLPESYPGHSLLTEDLGVLLGEDDCPCGRKGKYFKVLGRIPSAEVRGCGDTYGGGS